MASYAREESAGRIRALAEFLMDQLSSQPRSTDIEEHVKASALGRGSGRERFLGDKR